MSSGGVSVETVSGSLQRSAALPEQQRRLRLEVGQVGAQHGVQHADALLQSLEGHILVQLVLAQQLQHVVQCFLLGGQIQIQSANPKQHFGRARLHTALQLLQHTLKKQELGLDFRLQKLKILEKQIFLLIISMEGPKFNNEKIQPIFFLQY